MNDFIVPLGLLGLGLYVIMNINNDDNYKYVKNSGSLQMNDKKDANTVDNFFNTDNVKTINE